MTNLSLKLSLSADPTQLKAGLIEAQNALQAQQSALRVSLEKSTAALDKQKAKTKEVGEAFRAQLEVGPPTAAALAAFEKANAALAKARDTAVEQAQALRGVKARAEDNQKAIAAAARAEKALIEENKKAAVEAAAAEKAALAQAATAANAAHRQRLADLQEELRARRELALEAAREAQLSAGQAGNRVSSQLAVARQEAAQIAAASAAANAGVEQTRQGFRGMVADVAHVYTSVAGFFLTLKAISGAAAGLARVADEMKGIDARVRLSSGSLLEFSGNLAAIRVAANAAGGMVAETAALFNRIAQPIRDMGGSAEQARHVIADVGNALRISGASAAEASSTLLQFTQALGSGVLRGEELNAILENSPRLATAIAAGLGVTVGEMRRLGEQGALTSAQVLKALQSQSGALAEQAQRLPRTVGQATTALGESLKKFVGEADAATGASTALARGIDFMAGHIDGVMIVGAPLVGLLSTLAVRLAATTAATAGLSVAARALGVATGPIGAIVTVLAIGAAAWTAWANKGKEAAAKNGQSLAEMTKDFQDFAAKMGEQEKAAATAALQDKVAEARDKLLNPEFRADDDGKKLAEDVRQAAAAIDKLAASEQQLVQNRTKERGLFALYEKGLSGLGFMDKDMSDKLKAFDVLYREFTGRRQADNNKLIASTADVREAMAQLFAQAKNSGDFSMIQNRLEAILSTKPLANRATFTSELENAIHLKGEADRTELEALTTGLAARLTKEGEFLRSAVDQALLKVSSANAIARVTAELRQDPGGVAKVDRANAEAELTAARTLANQKLAALETVAQREHQLIKERMTAVQDQVSTEVNGLAGVREARLAALRDQEVELESKKRTGLIGEAVYRQAIARIADEQVALSDLSAQRQEVAQKSAQLEEARGRAGIEASRSMVRAEAETAVKRRAILEELQAAYKQKFAEALQAYQAYAQQVISLDKKIASNRLDTASAINTLQRSDMSPKDQLKSLRDELASVKAETDKAVKGGDKDSALELLNRQKSLAQQIGQQSGDGIDKKEQIKEGSAELKRIGEEAEAIMQKQRAVAAEAAAAAAKQAQESAAAMNKLAEQLAGLNAKAEIELKPTIDQAALEAAKTAVQQAFAGLTVPIKVVASGLPDAAAGAPRVPSGPQGPVVEEVVRTSRAYGGPLPGNAPHDRADNMMYWGTPGEWVIQRPAVRHYGSAFIAAVNAMALPKFAFGGQLGGNSAINRLAIPSLPAGRGESPRVGATFDLGNLGRVPVQMAAQDHDNLARRMALEALKFGGRR